MIRRALLLVAVVGAQPTLVGAKEPVADTPAVITVSKASDALGAPIALRSSAAVASAASGLAPVIGGRPLTSLSLTSPFGMRRHPTLGGERMHSGVDLAAPAGSPVYATAGGVVSFANWSGGYGLLVIVDHGGQLETRFGHLSQLMVSRGQSVVQGQVLGLVGSTGRSTGPHLHYEVRRGRLAVNPLARR